MTFLVTTYFQAVKMTTLCLHPTQTIVSITSYVHQATLPGMPHVLMGRSLTLKKGHMVTVEMLGMYHVQVLTSDLLHRFGLHLM